MPSPVWPLPIYLDSWTYIPGFYGILFFYSIRLYFDHQSHPLLGVVFAFTLSLYSFWSYFSSSCILSTYQPGEFIFQHLFFFFFFIIVSFCLFILFMVFSRQEYWSGFPFPSPVDHVLSELFTMTCPCWVALHGMAYRFIELDKAVIHVISSVSFLWLWFSFSLSSDEEGQETYGSFLMGETN